MDHRLQRRHPRVLEEEMDDAVTNAAQEVERVANATLYGFMRVMGIDPETSMELRNAAMAPFASVLGAMITAATLRYSERKKGPG